MMMIQAQTICSTKNQSNKQIRISIDCERFVVVNKKK
jgi:hypothetical protein